MSDVQARLLSALGDRYVIERELGRGGMATVYLAEDRKHHRLVALKLLRPEVAAILGPERFLREIEIAARLTHPHILAVFDSGEADGLLYYVMPYVQGESLRERLVREQMLPVAEAVSITRKIASALAYAHASGVVHRDIKPENILLHQGEAVVADFGIAWALTEATEARFSEPGLIIGTPAYMSPEQVEGRPVDGRSDTYSLGCVLYEMLVGHPPFVGETENLVFAQHQVELPPSPRTSRPAVPLAVERALETALAKLPADRFPTAMNFAEALAPTSGPYDSITQAMYAQTPLPVIPAPSARPGSWVVPLALVLAVLLIGGLAWRVRHSALGAVPPAQDPTHVAVLYFEDGTEDGTLRPIATGLTEDLIDQLGSVEQLDVVSANGVRPFRGTAVSLDSIARQLAVGTLVTGTVAGSPDRPQVTVRLIDVGTGRQIASQVMRRSGSDLLALRAELAQEVAGFLRQRLGREITLRQLRATTSDSRAWLLVRRVEAMRDDAHALYAAGDTAAVRRELDTADSLLVAAEAADRRWPWPTVRRAQLVVDRIQLSAPGAAGVKRWAPEGIALAASALARSAGYPPALMVRGQLRYMRWEYGSQSDSTELVAAEQDLRAAAVPENPSEASAWSSLSGLLVLRGSFAEANVAAERAYRSDAFLLEAPEVIARLHYTALVLRRWNDASRWCQEGHRRFAADWRFTYCRLTLMLMPGDASPDPRHAWALAAEADQLLSAGDRATFEPRLHIMVAGVLARAGQGESARAVLTAARRLGAGDTELDFYEAATWVLLGRDDTALDLLERYVGRNPGIKVYIRADPIFQALRDNPRFRALVWVAP